MRTSALARPPAAGQPLYIALLGPPSVEWQQRMLPIARRQTRALLFRLAAALQPVPRDHLAFLFWPDSPDAVARRNLTVLLAQLRRALPSPDMLVTTGDAIALNPGRVHVDTAALATAMPGALRDRQAGKLAEAARLYRGPFLEGFALADSPEFEAWAEQERQAWERRYMDALAALVEWNTAAGAYSAAIEAAQRALATDELAEDMHRHLIELYAAIGDRSAALRQFERCVDVLERELGVGPLPETRAVYDAVRDGTWSANGRVSGGAGRAAATAPGATREARFQVPAPPNPLIGRAAEVAAARTITRERDVRLLTLYGPGGSGKTRLALQVAEQLRDDFADGVVFVPLAPLLKPDHVLDAIAQACGIQDRSAEKLRGRLREELRDKRLLLVLDNFEHLLAAAPLVAELLAGAPHLVILATSRALLNLQGEHGFCVPPLPLPDLDRLPALEELAEQPAVALLLARARSHLPGCQLTASNAADLAAICHRLDGLPLAIELAAARLRILSPQALLKRLDRRLALLGRGPRDLPDRHQTLRAAIEWSYRLLDPRRSACSSAWPCSRAVLRWKRPKRCVNRRD